MPHERKRDLTVWLEKMLKFSPIVGVFGHRQVGKTTLVSRYSDSYVSFDRRSVLMSAEKDPEGFLSQFKYFPVVLDECQLCPDLFPALKERIRVNKKPGQFILTGSVRFTSRKAIRESLTGRITQADLLPMGLSEIHQKPLKNPVLWNDPLQLRPSKYCTDKSRLGYLKNGGLPGVCFVREASLRIQKIEDQLQTILDRDLRLILKTTLSYQSVFNLLRFLAKHQAEPIELSQVVRSTRISKPTIKKILFAFEAMYLIRPLPSEGDLKKSSYFFEDQGEASFLVPEGFSEDIDLLRFLYANLRLQFKYRPELQPQFFKYETRSGSYVPLAIRTNIGSFGIIPSLEKNPSKHLIGSAQSFLNTYTNSKVFIVHTHEGSVDKLTARLFVVPASFLI